MTVKSRLDEIENSLNPKQSMIAWMEEAHKFATLDEYGAWAAKHYPPLNRLADRVEIAICKRMKGATQDELRRVVRREVLELAFLFFLHLRVNQGFERELRALKLLAALEAALVMTASRERRSKRTLRSAGDDPFRNMKPGSLAFEVLGHKGVVEDVAKKYFDGHPVLFRGLAEELAQVVQVVHTIRNEWKSLALREARYRKGEERRVAAGREYRIHCERLKVLEERFSFTFSESLIDGAKADALSFLGEDRASFELVRQSWLRNMNREVGKDPESAG